MAYIMSILDLPSGRHLTNCLFFLNNTQTIVFCTGQIYYELLAEREKRGLNDVALVRLEQIAPFAFDRVAENVAKYPDAEVIWAQQEPK